MAKERSNITRRKNRSDTIVKNRQNDNQHTIVKDSEANHSLFQFLVEAGSDHIKVSISLSKEIFRCLGKWIRSWFPRRML